MNGTMILLGPGSELPTWAAALDLESFGDAWGPLEEQELLWAREGEAFARWRAVPTIGEAELLRIAVAPAARRKGGARELLRASEAALRAAGVRVLRLEVRVSNAPARALYEAEGWRLEGLRRAYYRNGEDAALYSKELQD